MPFPTMSTEVYSAPRNLKFKITTKGIRSDSDDKSRVNIAKVLVKNGQKVIGSGNKRSELNVLVEPSIPAKSCKRKPEVSLGSQSGKKQKMDRLLKIQCGNILKELMNHWAAYIFIEPVDPVKLNIPDYFSIITNPMDLGTVKRKLEDNVYFSAEEFAADVKLTFFNATVYNPDWHDVHKWAKEMNVHFCRRWKSLKAKLKEKNDEKGSFVHRVENNGRMTKQAVETNQQDTKSIGLSKKSIDSLPDDQSLWKLRTKVSVMDATCGNMKPARIALKVCSSLRRTVQKEPCSRSTCAPAKQSQSVESAQAKCSSCVSFTCHCRLKNGYAQASTSDISSERSSENNQCGDSKLDCEAKGPFHRSSSSQDSDGPGVVMHEEKSPHLSAPATTAAASVEGWGSLNVQMSPSKALRAALLKSRFADTIFRATHQVEKSDPLRMQQEKETLEREKQEEKARIEAEIKAAEAASNRKKQDDLKMKRERERAAARMALEKMEKSVEIYENLDIIKDVEMLCFGFQTGKTLERLGLYLKDDYLEDDEDATLYAEEGEILS